MGFALFIGLLASIGPGSAGSALARGVGLRPQSADAKPGPATLEVIVGPEATAGDNLVLRLASKELRNMEVQRIVPAPLKVQLRGDDFEYVFPVRHPNESLCITFFLKASRVGKMPVHIGFPSGETLALSRFFYQ